MYGTTDYSKAFIQEYNEYYWCAELTKTGIRVEIGKDAHWSTALETWKAIYNHILQSPEYQSRENDLARLHDSVSTAVRIADREVRDWIDSNIIIFKV